MEKEKNKAATEVEGQFRSELLKVKAENNTFKYNIQTLETDLSDVSNEKEAIQREIKDLDTKLKVKVKNFTSLEVKMQSLREEKECSDLMNENLISDLKLSKLSRESQESCNFCECKFESKLQLKAHIQADHHKCQGIQCGNNFVRNEGLEATQGFNYKCFYCDNMILSRDNLQKHKSICHGIDPSELMQGMKPVTLKYTQPNIGQIFKIPGMAVLH